MACLDCILIFTKILWRLFQLHLLLFARTYALNVKNAFTAGACPRISNCPIMRTKQFINRQASLLSNSFRLHSGSDRSDRASGWSLSPLSVALNSRSQQMLLFMTNHETQMACSGPHECQMAPTLLERTNDDDFTLSGGLTGSTDYLDSASKPHLQSMRMNTPSTALTSVAQYFEMTIPSKSHQRSGSLTAGELDVVVLGLSHHNAGVEVREKLAIPEAEWRTAAADLVRSCPSVAEASVLSTCNRFEIYLATTDSRECVREAVDWLVARSQNALDKESLNRVLFALNSNQAMWHLLRVAAGLDSLVVGEGQILAQVKKSFELCSLAAPVGESKNGGVGCDEASKIPEAENTPPAGRLLSKLLNTAVTAGKRARAETGIAKGAVSISSAAAQFTAQHVARDCLIGHIRDANVCIIGTGKMARLLLVHLQTEGVKSVTVVNRSPNRFEELRAEFPNMDIKFEPMEQLWDVIADSDVVFPSTSSKVAIITPEPLMQSLTRRQRPGGLQFIDISVPRNVHPDCSHIKGVFNYNVDFLKAAVDRNTAMRQKEIIEVENLLKFELDKFLTWKQSLSAVPTINKLQELGEQLRQTEVAKIASCLGKKLDANEMKMVEKLSRNIVNKLLHGPMKMLRNMNSNKGSESEGLTDEIKENPLLAVQTIRKAFQMEEP
jgi:glutamyl-tRNA reductase